MRRVALVANPAAGHGRGGRLLARVHDRLAGAGLHVDAHAADSYDDARLACEDAVAGGADALVVVGGDGMAHLGHNACARTGVPLGIVPAGTGNDFARAAGVPSPWRAAADAVIAGHTRTVDLMEVRGDLVEGPLAYVGSVVSTGFDQRVAARAERLPYHLGAPTYAFAVLEELRQFVPLRYRLAFDGRERHLEAMLVAVANAGIFGGGIRIAPDFDLADGLLDVTIVHPTNRRTLLALFPKLFTGAFTDHPAVERLRVSSIVVDGPDLTASADGEPLGPVPVDCSASPGALRLLVRTGGAA